MLFVYAKMHNDVSYIQGMNDLSAPMYYCFSIGDDPNDINYVEVDN